MLNRNLTTFNTRTNHSRDVANYIKKTELKLKTELRDKIGTEH